MTSDRAQPAVALDPGGAMPLVGLGTWQMTGTRCQAAVRAALDVGYRHIDTATMYGNEREVGRAVRESGVPREQVFVTTKLPPGAAGRERRTLDASLRALGTDHVDLWLVHWPPRGRALLSTWEELLAARDRGLARAVGVSNYRPAQLDELIAATGVAPQVNQIPWAPALYDAALLGEHRRLQEHRPGPPGAGRDRRPPRGDARSGGGALAPRPPGGGDPQVGHPRADRG